MPDWEAFVRRRLSLPDFLPESESRIIGDPDRRRCSGQAPDGRRDRRLLQSLGRSGADAGQGNRRRGYETPALNGWSSSAAGCGAVALERIRRWWGNPSTWTASSSGSSASCRPDSISRPSRATFGGRSGLTLPNCVWADSTARRSGGSGRVSRSSRRSRICAA